MNDERKHDERYNTVWISRPQLVSLVAYIFIVFIFLSISLPVHMTLYVYTIIVVLSVFFSGATVSA